MHNSGQEATIKGTDHTKVHRCINSTHDQSIYVMQVEVRLTIFRNYWRTWFLSYCRLGCVNLRRSYSGASFPRKCSSFPRLFPHDLVHRVGMVCHAYQLRYVTKINQGPTHLHYSSGHTPTNPLDPTLYVRKVFLLFALVSSEKRFPRSSAHWIDVLETSVMLRW